MRKGFGVICVVISVLLIVKGHDVATSMVSHAKQVLFGAPVDKALQLYEAGTGLGLFGLLLIFWNRK